jgi:hypothetical protein
VPEKIRQNSGTDVDPIDKRAGVSCN